MGLDTKVMFLPLHSDLEEVLLTVIQGPVVHLDHSIRKFDLYSCQHWEGAVKNQGTSNHPKLYNHLKYSGK